jgi:EXPERA (EXPanded EBP superfamily)
MTRGDRITLWFIVFFCAVAITIEAYWLLHVHDMAQQDHVLARGFAFYGRGDRGYYNEISGFELTLEAINVFITVPAYIVLAYAIINRRPWRWPWQLCVSAYVTYSVILYFTAKHAVGYSQMAEHDLASFLILYVPNLPWLIGNGFFAIEAARVIMRVVRQREQPA